MYAGRQSLPGMGRASSQFSAPGFKRDRISTPFPWKTTTSVPSFVRASEGCTWPESRPCTIGHGTTSAKAVNATSRKMKIAGRFIRAA